jgi:hypothetical protein
MKGRTTVSAAAALVVAVLTLGACTTSVTGRAVRASSQPVSAVSARDLLLQSGDTTPLGPANAEPVGRNYFTSARPPECSAALLFEGSPLRPAGSRDHAESSYKFDSQALYAESVDIYDKDLNTHDVIWNGFSAVSNCHGDAVPVSPAGVFPPMRLSFFAVPADGVLAWTMTRPDWTCDYGLAVLRRVALMLSACNGKPGFPMADWASKRRAQLESKA